MINWRQFTADDWRGFAGCTRFPNDDPPWIAELLVNGNLAIAVVDATGVVVYVNSMKRYTDEGEPDDVWATHPTYEERHAQYAANAALSMRPEMTSDELEHLGLVPQ